MNLDTKLHDASVAVRSARQEAEFTVKTPGASRYRPGTPALALMASLAVLVAIGVPSLKIAAGSEPTGVGGTPTPPVTETSPSTTATDTTDTASRTGRAADGPESEEGTGRMIRLDAPETPDLILEMAVGIELPPGGTFDRMIDNLPDEPTTQAESGIMSTLEFVAGCEWTGYWLDSVAAGDTVAQTEAQAVLDQIPTWPALTASDGGGVIDAWTRNARLAASGDVQGVLDNLYTNNCTDVVPGH